MLTYGFGTFGFLMGTYVSTYLILTKACQNNFPQDTTAQCWSTGCTYVYVYVTDYHCCHCDSAYRLTALTAHHMCQLHDSAVPGEIPSVITDKFSLSQAHDHLRIINPTALSPSPAQNIPTVISQILHSEGRPPSRVPVLVHKTRGRPQLDGEAEPGTHLLSCARHVPAHWRLDREDG